MFSLTRKNPTMLFDRDPDRPRPGDIAQMKPGNSIGADADDTFVIVEDFPPNREHIVLNLPAGHPDREDWAATIALEEITTLTRFSSEGSRTWAPKPDAGA